MLGKIQDTYGETLNYLESNVNLTSLDKQKTLYVYAQIVTQCVEITSESIDLVTSGKFKMTDSDRLRFLKQSEDKLNKKMSELRAQYIHDLLVAYKVPKSRLAFWGLGGNSPLATNDTENGRAKNRRVEFVILSTIDD